MFSSGPNYTKLKTNLRLAITRLKLLEKKKIELTQKSRKEIADYLATGKVERARIRVEHIIREDYMVEAMEMIEMFCDLLLARFGLVQQMKTMDPGLAEAISSILWAGPRLITDIQEMKPICEQLVAKYGKLYGDSCRDESAPTISEKLKHKMGVQAPPKVLVEKYLIEISKNFSVPYEPDAELMNQDKSIEALLIDVGDDNKNNLGGNEGGGGGGIAPPGFKDFPQAPPMVPPSDFQPFNYPTLPGSSNNVNIGGFVLPPGSSSHSSEKMGYGVPFSYNIPVENVPKAMNYMPQNVTPPPSYSNFEFPDPVESPSDSNQQNTDKPKPSPRSKISPPDGHKPKNTDLFPDLPNVPNDVPNLTDEERNSRMTRDTNDDIDFDDLTKRFELLKQKK